jgi:Mn2+/Fe2+ NRAMP family transporter
MKQWLQVTLGILTAIGGFLDVGATATAGEAGSRFGLGLVWAMLLGTLAIMLLVTMVGRLTAVAGKPYAAAIREHFGFKFYLVPLSSELIANSIMLAAELGGMAIALSLLTGLNWHILFPVSVLLVFAMTWRGPFSLIENGPSILGLLTLSFIAGIVAAGGPSRDLVPTLWRPELKPGDFAEYLFLAAAILGAIISPYLVYFYSSGAQEEHWGKRALPRNRVIAITGMGFGSVSAIALLVLSAIVLQPMHIGSGTLGEIGLGMAHSLGRLGGLLFAIALFACCLGAALEVTLAVGYEVSQGFGWQYGQDVKPAETPRFNLVMIVILLVALGIGFLGIDPLQLTIYGSALTALLLPVSLSPFLIIMNDRDYLGDKTNNRATNFATVGVIALAFIVAAVSIPLLFITGGGG